MTDQRSGASPTPSSVRDADLRRLADETWDVLIVGGGIVGAGALLDAASRGLKAALVEQDDVASGTSSRSSRLIHGGLRYLEQMHVGLVREALHERARLLRLAPHLVRLESFLFPLYGLPVVTRAFFEAGLTMYDELGSAKSGGRHRHLGLDETLEFAPNLRRKDLRGAMLYHDGMEDQIGALGLVLNAVVLFNTRYMDAAVTQLRTEGFDVRDEDLARLSPFARHHINMLGRYSFILPDLPEGLRPLGSSTEPADPAEY